MLNPSFRELAEKGDSRYTLAMVIAKRARQIIEHDEAMEGSEFDKPVSTALREMLDGKITYEKE